MDPSPFVRSSFWTVSIGLTTLWISNLGVNQTCIQRFLAVPDITFARKSVWIFVAGLIFIKGASCFVGLIMYAKYERCDPVKTKQIEKVDQILPFFVMEVASQIPGLPGVFVAGIFSAALSSLSSGLNTLAGTIYEDFIRHKYPDASEKRVSDTMKLLVIILGAIIVSLVFVVEHMGQVFRVNIAVAGLTAGSLLGLFTVGMMSRYVNTKGVIYGAILSMLIVTTIMIGAQSLPKPKPLPTLDKCDSSNYMLNSTTNISLSTMMTTPIVNETNSSNEKDDKKTVDDDIPLIFKISFMYYTLLGSILLVIIAYFVSWLTGGCPPFDEKLLATFMRSKNYVNNLNENGPEPILLQQQSSLKNQQFLPQKISETCLENDENCENDMVTELKE
jgi:solute carrier family 5 (sodium-coupled monocarboxylate transporter), member 8/12